MSAADNTDADARAKIMRAGYGELIASHAASARRSKNRNAETALERVVAALSYLSTEALLAKGAEK